MDTRDGDGDRFPWLGSRLSHGWQRALWGIVLALAIVIPGLTHHNLTSVEAVAWYKYVNTTMLVAVLSAVLFGVVYFASRRRTLGALRLTAIVMLAMFLWPGFSRLDMLWGLLGPLMVVLVPAGVVWGVARHGNRSRVAALTLLFASTLLIANAVKVAQRPVLDPPVASFTLSDAAPHRPDVLFVLLDAYGRDDTLDELYGFDNTPFLTVMGDLGFSVNRSASANYNRTYASLASIMDLGYPIEPGLATDEQNGIVRGLLGQEGTLPTVFREAGYELTYSENGWGGSRCGSNTDNCWREGTTVMSAYRLAQLTPFAPVVRSLFVHPTAANSFGQLKELASVFNDRAARDEPQVVMAHFIIPHPPLRLDRSCKPHRESWRNRLTMTMGDSYDGLRRAAYIDQVVCVNTTLISQLEQIVAQNPGTAIYVFGDHGPDGSGQLSTNPTDMTPSQISERMGVLLAVREPSGCYDRRSTKTLTTAARAFVSCSLGIDLHPISERSILVPFRARPVAAVEIDPVGRG